MIVVCPLKTTENNKCAGLGLEPDVLRKKLELEPITLSSGEPFLGVCPVGTIKRAIPMGHADSSIMSQSAQGTCPQATIRHVNRKHVLST